MILEQQAKLKRAIHIQEQRIRLADIGAEYIKHLLSMNNPIAGLAAYLKADIELTTKK